jgi:hypothetical protein
MEVRHIHTDGSTTHTYRHVRLYIFTFLYRPEAVHGRTTHNIQTCTAGGRPDVHGRTTHNIQTCTASGLYIFYIFVSAGLYIFIFLYPAGVLYIFTFLYRPEAVHGRTTHNIQTCTDIQTCTASGLYIFYIFVYIFYIFV